MCNVLDHGTLVYSVYCVAESHEISCYNGVCPQTSLLSAVVWGVVWGVKHMGAAGVEGGVNVAAVHLQAMCGSLAVPHREPGLALATAALVEALAPHAALWIVLHQASYTQLTAATTRCIHTTKHLLCTPRVRHTVLSV